MSTKGLMEHKKVAEVTVHGPDTGKLAGKAATLTLKEPWLFDGQRGPFTLTNVEHGHHIVRGAYNEAHGPGATSTRTEKPPKAPGAPKERARAPEGLDPIPALPRKPSEPRAQFTGSKPMFVYRTMAVSEDAGHEATGWFLSDRELPAADLRAYAKNQLHLALKKGYTADQYKFSAKRFTVKDEQAAKKDGTMGSPWAQEHIILGDG